jgi:hypothetical protein
MIDKEYTNNKQIQRYLGVDAEVSDTKPYILSAQKFIESYTARVFRADNTATARKFDGLESQQLNIDDCVDITLVERGNDSWGDSLTTITAGGATGYYTLPTNNASLDLPINALLLRSSMFISGHANHQVTAKWGYSEKPPSDIVFATTVLSSGMYYANKGENSGAIKSEKIGEYQVSYADGQGFKDMEMAMSILDRYRKFLI